MYPELRLPNGSSVASVQLEVRRARKGALGGVSGVSKWMGASMDAQDQLGARYSEARKPGLRAYQERS
jgi:hypothetical protein